MSLADPIERVLVELLEADIEIIVVGGLAGVLMGAPVVTFDVDVVHRRTPENVDRLPAQRQLLGRARWAGNTSAMMPEGASADGKSSRGAR